MNGLHPPRARLAFLFAVFCGGYSCLCGRSFTSEREERSGTVTFCEMRFKHAGEGKRCEAEVALLFSNRSERTICLLPSESAFTYWLDYDGRGSSLGGRARSTLSTSAKSISDLDLSTLVISPNRTEKFFMTFPAEIPKEMAGRLHLEYQCKPNYGGSDYRGIPLCRNSMRTTMDIVVFKCPQTNELIIRPRLPEKELLPKGCRGGAGAGRE